MNGLTRARLLGPAALFAICLALVLPGIAVAAAAPTYTKETQQEFEQQLKSGEISSGTFNKRVRNLHVTLKNGKLYLYHYGKKESAKLSNELKAHHITVTVLTPDQAKAEIKTKSKPAHKLRYIAGGILIVVLIVVAVVLLVNRRRRQNEE